MLIIACSGLLANGSSAFIISKPEGESLNVKGVFLHVLADAADYMGVISAGLIMYFTGWYQADPIINMMIGLLIFTVQLKLARDSVNILLEGGSSRNRCKSSGARGC